MATKAKRGAPRRAQKKTRQRSTLLAIILIFVIVHGLLLTALTLAEMSYRGEVLHPVVWITFIAASLLHALAGYGLWKWQKWGLNLYLAAATMTAFVGLIGTGSLLVVFAAFIPLAVVGYVVRLNWRDFE